MDREMADALARSRLRMGISGVNYDAAFRNIVRGVVLVASGFGSPDQGD
jgi:hypothetical protein